MNIGDRIKNKRLKLDINQNDLAEKIGVSKQTLYKYENSIVTNIPSDKIELLAQYLHCSPEYLMGWTDESKNNYSLTNLEIEHIEKYRAVDDTTRTIVDTILDRETSRPVLMAAHNEHIDEPDETKNIKYDLEYLKNMKNN
jgi:transcriptional regulator with XRE-family HTH domain